ncbi:hypothetical protein LCGC14_1286170 [marine sediment metagenome]|uniref:Uncharacterized protein n=1 Tax=marine sediment metagenome TaxID=412755 RepID=A0A0F9KVF3_9ZZZZ
MKRVTIWCYKCGRQWSNRQVSELYAFFARCLFSSCNGYTDGVEVKE